MSWFKKPKISSLSSGAGKPVVPDGTWEKCPGCSEMVPADDLKQNLNVCPKCGHHNRLSALRWIEILADSGTFKPLFEEIISDDPLNFVDSKPYTTRVEEATKKGGTSDAIICGTGRIFGHEAAFGIMNFFFMGGSMGSVVGERVVRICEFAIEKKLPLFLLTSSGGARMQEGILSLMQMARTSAAIGRCQEQGGFVVSILVDPTTGGTTASFSMLGDVIIAEPGALIGFAGPRVIEQTIRQKLPPRFQTAEFVQEHGFVDMIVPRHEMKDRLHYLIHVFVEKSPPDVN